MLPYLLTIQFCVVNLLLLSRNLVQAQIVECPRQYPSSACSKCQYCCFENKGCCGVCHIEQWYFWVALVFGIACLISIYVCFLKCYRKKQQRQTMDGRHEHNHTSEQSIRNETYELTSISRPPLYDQPSRQDGKHNQQLRRERRQRKQRHESEEPLQRLSQIELQQQEFRLEHELQQVKKQLTEQIDRHSESTDNQNNRENRAYDPNFNEPPLYSTIRFNRKETSK